MTISLSEDDFTITNQKIAQLQHKDSKKYYKNLDSISKDMGVALSSLQENLAGIEQEISNLESRLNDLRALRQLILHKLHEIGMDSFEDNERKVLYKIVVDSPSSVAELSELIDEKESSLRSILTSMRSKLDKDSAQLLFRGLR